MSGQASHESDPHGDDGRENGSPADVEAVEVSRDELTAEADQFLELSGADPETSSSDAAPTDTK